MLVVEDQVATQDLERALFDELGCKMDMAASGHAASELFAPGKYDIVFIDIGLEDTTGYVVSKTLRKVEQNTTSRASFIGLTTYDSEVVQYDCKDYGMDAVFTKPLSAEQAMEIINHFVFHHGNLQNLSNGVIF